MLRRIIAAAAVALAVASAATTRADIVFNNFGPGDTFGTTVGWGFGNPNDVVSSMAFTVGAGTSYKLTEIDLAAGFISGTNSVTVSIRSDSGGTPGATLESWTIPMTGQYGTLYPPEMVTSVLNPILAANQQYWVSLAPGAADAHGAWSLNTTADQGPVYVTIGGNPSFSGTNFRGAFRVLGTPATGTPTPEPATLVPTLIGALVLTGYGWRRRVHRGG
jgi:hypothetical protein